MLNRNELSDVTLEELEARPEWAWAEWRIWVQRAVEDLHVRELLYDAPLHPTMWFIRMVGGRQRHDFLRRTSEWGTSTRSWGARRALRIIMGAESSIGALKPEVARKARKAGLARRAVEPQRRRMRATRMGDDIEEAERLDAEFGLTSTSRAASAYART